MKPKMIQRTGVVLSQWRKLGCAPAGTECSDYLEEDMLSDPPELNLSTCQRSGGTTGVTASLRHLAYWDEVVPNQAETYCTNLRSSSGALTVDERNIIGSTGPVDNAVSVDWDFCTLTQVFQVNRLKPSASEGYDPSGVGGACILESTPTGWKLRAPMRARADIRCRAQCFKLIFGE